MAKRKTQPPPDEPDRKLMLPPKPMRRGTLSERFTKCGKSGCLCATEGEARHGPYYSLTRGVDGTTRSRWLSAEQAGIAQRQIEEGDRFRRDVERFWVDCEHLADGELDLARESAEGQGERGGSRRRSRRRLRKKSSD